MFPAKPGCLLHNCCYVPCMYTQTYTPYTHTHRHTHTPVHRMVLQLPGTVGEVVPLGLLSADEIRDHPGGFPRRWGSHISSRASAHLVLVPHPGTVVGGHSAGHLEYTCTQTHAHLYEVTILCIVLNHRDSKGFTGPTSYDTPNPNPSKRASRKVSKEKYRGRHIKKEQDCNKYQTYLLHLV